MRWRYFFGILVVLIGVGYYVDLSGLAPSFSMLNVWAGWWPVLIVALSLNYLFRQPENPWATLVIMGAGLVLLIRFQNVKLAPSELVPFILSILFILFGLRLLLPRIQRRPRRGAQGPAVNFRHSLKDFAVFTSMQFYNESQQFQGGKLMLFCSDYEIDLREAQVSQQGAELELGGVIGQVMIRIPEHMAYRIEGKPFLGSLDNRVRSLVLNEPGRPTLTIRINAALSGVTLTN